jgi:uncharacterized membrane protein YozB (DUF420 family)/cytochrome oxidase Cu insertion factor (SCO1/SenC/PrrC family)
MIAASSRRPRAFFVGALLCLFGATPVLAQASPGADDPLRFSEVPDFSFVERDGRRISLADLLGEPWIAVPFFIGCSGPCPGLTSDLHQAFRERLAGSGVRVVSFSLDPAADTRERLVEYAASYGIQGDSWLFLTGEDQAALHAFLRNGLKVPVAVSEDAALVYGQSITHGTRLPVIDPQGRIAGWYEASRMSFGPDTAAFEASLDALVGRALALRPSTSILPLVNACLNGITFLLLLAGLSAISLGKRDLHGRLMRTAFAFSAAFLASYLYYHLVVQADRGPTPFNGEGAARVGYLVLLASHVVLAIINLPMVLRTLWLAHREDWERHRRWARRTLPIWLYVSVTGVAVYVILYHLNPTP